MNFTPITTDDKILVMPGAVVCGDVTVGEGTAFWFNSVCRAELQSVKIGKRCNIQDCAVIHNLCTLGDDVSVGHGAIVHGATVGDRVIIGMGAIILDGAKIGDDCIIAAGAVVTGKMDAPAGSLIVGSPATVAKELNDKQRESITYNSELYYKKSVEYRAFLETQK
ncbi:MAG: gamma carbonic anhydrase family protein [Oscillospiraceae bacterium]|nr:gamma carbonic anhydrase family protein [Oscillospiraceae bacterium]